MKSYQINPRSPELGGGWRLQLLEDGEEVGGGVFPAEDNQIMRDEAYEDALAEATTWLATRGEAK
jgi:hypothetical protein